VYEGGSDHHHDSATAAAAGHCGMHGTPQRHSAQRASWPPEEPAANERGGNGCSCSCSARRELTVAAPVAAVKWLPVSAPTLVSCCTHSNMRGHTHANIQATRTMYVVTTCDRFHTCRPMYRRVFRIVGRDLQWKPAGGHGSPRCADCQKFRCVLSLAVPSMRLDLLHACVLRHNHRVIHTRRLQTAEASTGLGAGTIRFTNYTSNPSTTRGAPLVCSIAVWSRTHSSSATAPLRSLQPVTRV
jgi:hypothetical protein